MIGSGEPLGYRRGRAVAERFPSRPGAYSSYYGAYSSAYAYPYSYASSYYPYSSAYYGAYSSAYAYPYSSAYYGARAYSPYYY